MYSTDSNGYQYCITCGESPAAHKADDMREARRQIMAVTDPQAQTALFTVLGLLQQVSEELERVRHNAATNC